MGTLYIIATPIGNLKDITLRALEVLKSVDYVLCEDTRVSGRLLSNFEIKANLVKFTDFNEAHKVDEVLKDLGDGKKIGLISDAGTPLVSDPGYKLVRAAIEHKIKVETIPGASSVLAAITISGLAPDKFTFVGYLPKKEGKKKNFLKDASLAKEKIKSTFIAYESPFRLLDTLECIKSVFGNCEMAVCRELTKMHEEVLRDNVSNLIDHFSKNKPKGEFVILF